MQLMDKTTFLKKYRSEHSQIGVYTFLSIALDIVGAILIVLNAKDLIGYHLSSDEPKFILLILLGVLCWVIGFIFLSLVKKIENDGIKEYEKYLISQTQNQNFTGWVCPKCNNYNDSNSLICSRCSEAKPYFNSQNNNIDNSNSWICPKCGKVNQNYVGTCGCGEVKPK